MQANSGFNLPIAPLLSKSFRERGQEGVVKWDVIPASDGSRVRIVFEAAKKNGRHGVWLATDGSIAANGQQAQSMDIWQDTAPSQVDVVVRTTGGLLHVYNIWDIGNGRGSQSWSSGMKVEQLDTGRRYRCNDIGFTGDFDDLVFRLERIA